MFDAGRAGAQLGGLMIDSHSHIYMERYDADREAVIARAAAAGVTQLLQVGCDLEESRTVVAMSERVPGIYASVGEVHGARVCAGVHSPP
jgi:TatD DNase family protein